MKSNDELHFHTQEAVFLTGALLASGWRVWVFIALLALAWAARLVEHKRAREWPVALQTDSAPTQPIRQT